MAKKRRSAKQKAATRKLVKFNKSRRKTKTKTRRKASTKRKTRRKANKSRKTKKRSMAKGGTLKKIPLINNPTVKKVFIAAGAASIITSVLTLVSPQAAALANSTVGRGVIGFATGDVVGAVANVVIPLIQNGGGGLLGGGGNGGNTNGFA